MASKKIAAVDWEKLLSKVDAPDAKRMINLFRAKSNEINTEASKYLKDPEPIDFEGYKKKLKFTASAVEKLEASYKTRSLPSYHATIPSLIVKKREALLSTLKNFVEAANNDLQDMQQLLKDFEQIKISNDTSVGDLRNRFPEIGQEIESEIKNHDWFK